MAFFEVDNPNMVALEKMVDATSMKVVLNALSTIAHLKAEHIRSTWQDRDTAHAWSVACRAVALCSNKVDC